MQHMSSSWPRRISFSMLLSLAAVLSITTGCQQPSRAPDRHASQRKYDQPGWDRKTPGLPPAAQTPQATAPPRQPAPPMPQPRVPAPVPRPPTAPQPPAIARPSQPVPQAPPAPTAPQPQAPPVARQSFGGDFFYGGMPESEDRLTILTNIAYVVGYDEERADPAWSGYRLPGEVRFTDNKRPSQFKTDTRTRRKIAHDDYTNSGFDRGHMAPNYAIMSRFGVAAQHETFLMSNICPQHPNLNRGRWSQLEEKISGQSPNQPCWAKSYEQVWVIVGPLFEGQVSQLPSGVDIPTAFFAIVVDEDEATGHSRALAFIMPNQPAVPGSLTDYLTSIDEIELRSGLDFFSELDDDQEEVLELAPASELWPITR